MVTAAFTAAMVITSVPQNNEQMFEGNPVDIDGIIIPSDHPVFLSIVAVHVLAAVACVASGVIAMMSRKVRGRHTGAGKLYYMSMWVVFITACVVALLRWAQDYHLFILGVVAFISTYVARRALVKKWNRWPLYHITGMGISYIFLLIAFYVDNGRFLPIWKDLNTIYYWLIPVAVGVPILSITLATNPLSKSYFRPGSRIKKPGG